MNVRAAAAKEEDDLGGDAGNALKFAAGKAGGNASDRLNDIKDVPTFKKVITLFSSSTSIICPFIHRFSIQYTGCKITKKFLLVCGTRLRQVAHRSTCPSMFILIHKYVGKILDDKILWHKLSHGQVAGELTCPPQFLVVSDKRITCFFKPCYPKDI